MMGRVVLCRNAFKSCVKKWQHKVQMLGTRSISRVTQKSSGLDLVAMSSKSGDGGWPEWGLFLQEM